MQYVKEILESRKLYCEDNKKSYLVIIDKLKAEIAEYQEYIDRELLKIEQIEQALQKLEEQE